MLIAILQIIAGFILLMWGADRFVAGAAATARNFGVSTLLIGLTIVAMGTSAPEIFVSFMAACTKDEGGSWCTISKGYIHIARQGCVHLH